MFQGLEQGLTEAFNTKSVVEMFVTTVIPMAVAGTAAYLYGKRRERSKHKEVEAALQNNSLETESVLFSSTYFHPTGETNPATGNPINELRIINAGQIPLGSMFKGETEEYWVKYVNEAKKRCTEDNPCVLLHLRDVIPDSVKDKDVIIENFINDILNFGSDLMHDAKNVVQTVSDLGPLEAPAYTQLLPVLVYEEAAKNKQLRMLLIPAKVLEPGALPAFEDTRFRDFDENGDVVYRNDEGLNHVMRLRTLERISALYAENRLLFNRGMVNVLTGKTYTVEQKPFVANDNAPDAESDATPEAASDLG
ncbi:MAG: hypothetical protein GC137_02840 [Alphaproteobacteria bacterium]|nr:hypothetical protein [Alphaproteobacteria bacterium]